MKSSMKVIILLCTMAASASSSVQCIEKAFIDHEIVPDVLQVAPQKIANVRLHFVNLNYDLSPKSQLKFVILFY